jgi:amino acid transporter
LVRDHLSLTLPAWPSAAILVILSAANNGLGTQGRRQGQAIVLLMVIFPGFALLAIPQINLDHYTVTRPNWKQMLPLLMVPFVGVEVVAGLQGEMRRRTTDVARALLLTPSLGALLVTTICAVAVGVVGAKTLAGLRVPLAWLGSRLLQSRPDHALAEALDRLTADLVPLRSKLRIA